VQITSLNDYSNLVQESESAGWIAYHAVTSEQANRRLIVFAPDISANQDFRSAWRHDTELLRRLPHDGLPLILDTGDDDGIVYLATEVPSGFTLQQYIASHSLTWDETADLGWQAASVIQYLHNSGIAHGGLNEQSFRITEQLRVSLVDSGVARWTLAADDATAASNLTDQCRSDLVALGQLLEQLASTNVNTSEKSSEVPQEWWELITDLSDASADRFPTMAREVQARLGSILLKNSGESMDVFAERTGPDQSRHSIVDELLDTPITDQTVESQTPVSNASSSRLIVWAVILAVAIAAIIAAIVLL